MQITVLYHATLSFVSHNQGKTKQAIKYDNGVFRQVIRKKIGLTEKLVYSEFLRIPH